MATSTIKNQTKRAGMSAGYGTPSKALTTSTLVTVPISDNYVIDSNYFEKISAGGYKCLYAGIVAVEGSIIFSGANASDNVVATIGIYRADTWNWEGSLFVANGGTDKSCVIGKMFRLVQANDIIYLRARNTTAARGTADRATLVVEYL